MTTVSDMKLYVVYEMSCDRDIMTSVFLHEQDALSFVRGPYEEIRYVVPISASHDNVKRWYEFKDEAEKALEAW